MSTVISIDPGIPGYETEEVSAAKDLVRDHLYEFTDRWFTELVENEADFITAASDLIKALVETGWRPTE